MSVAVVVPVQPIWTKEHEECDDNFFSGSTIMYMSNNKGKIEVKVCDRCGYEEVRCLHLNNTIDYKNIRLVCELCAN